MIPRTAIPRAGAQKLYLLTVSRQCPELDEAVARHEVLQDCRDALEVRWTWRLAAPAWLIAVHRHTKHGEALSTTS